MKGEKLYWTCQIIGWSLYAAVGVLMFYVFAGRSWAGVLQPPVICTVALLLSHGYRGVIRQRCWMELPLAAQLPRIVLASVALSALLNLIAVLLLLFVFRLFTVVEMRPSYLLVYLVQWGTVYLIWSLLYFGFHHIEHRRRAEVERWQLAAAVKEAELSALKAQVNPHFLFNSLNSLRAMIAEDPARAEEMVTQLAGLLRHSLRATGAQTVTFGEEMCVVEDYLALERTRLEDRLRVSVEVDPASLAVPVPTMLVQTLVENSVKHGIVPRIGGGRLTLRSRVLDSMLHIEITNPGELDGVPNSDALGLHNAAERLRLLFGERATLGLEQSGAEPRVTAHVCIPVGGREA